MNDFNPQEAASAKPIPFHDHLTPEVRDEYVQLVINESQPQPVAAGTTAG